MDSLGLNHSGYAENNEILKDVAIASGTRLGAHAGVGGDHDRRALTGAPRLRP